MWPCHACPGCQDISRPSNGSQDPSCGSVPTCNTGAKCKRISRSVKGKGSRRPTCWSSVICGGKRKCTEVVPMPKFSPSSGGYGGSRTSPQNYGKQHNFATAQQHFAGRQWKGLKWIGGFHPTI
eukprot:scaffold281902_cov19-Tisochrysis_lutea.AAC.2